MTIMQPRLSIECIQYIYSQNQAKNLHFSFLHAGMTRSNPNRQLGQLNCALKAQRSSLPKAEVGRFDKERVGLLMWGMPALR
jgi:hypothetical protein